MIRRFSEFVINYRHGVFGFIVIMTLFFAHQAFQVKFRTEFGDLLPQTHPYVKVHNKFRDIFGGANVFFIAITRPRGSSSLSPELPAAHDRWPKLADSEKSLDTSG